MNHTNLRSYKCFRFTGNFFLFRGNFSSFRDRIPKGISHNGTSRIVQNYFYDFSAWKHWSICHASYTAELLSGCDLRGWRVLWSARVYFWPSGPLDQLWRTRDTASGWRAAVFRPVFGSSNLISPNLRVLKHSELCASWTRKSLENSKCLDPSQDRARTDCM